MAGILGFLTVYTDLVDDRNVVVVGYPRAELLDISCVTSTLDWANEYGVTPPYRTILATPGGRPIPTLSSIVVQAQAVLEQIVDPIDTLVVSGGKGQEAIADDPHLAGVIDRLAQRSRRVASVCTGTTILAATGILDGKKATTHWVYAQRMAARHPSVTVDADQIYLRQGNVYTSAGVTSAIDLTLALVAEDHGADAARYVARMLVTYLQRPGNQAQVSMFVEKAPPEHAVVQRVIDYIVANLDNDLSSATLSEVAGVSRRHLTRLVTGDTGVTPARLVRQMRLEAAGRLLAATSIPLPQVAAKCGFTSSETMRQAFVAKYETTPSRFRAANSLPAGAALKSAG